MGNKDDGDMRAAFAGLDAGAASSTDTILKIDLPNKLKTDLEAQCKVAASAELALNQPSADAKRNSASLKK